MVAQVFQRPFPVSAVAQGGIGGEVFYIVEAVEIPVRDDCLLYTSDAADD